jgi:lambda family phage portal protein
MARGTLLGPNGQPIQSAGVARSQFATSPRRQINAGFDAAETAEENRRHWAAADALSADAAASSGVRRTLRNRARYERKNNCYANGMTCTIASDCIGTGPRLRMLSGTDRTSRRVATTVEGLWQEWADSVNLAEKLRTMRSSVVTDGEGFALQITNQGLDFPVKLDLRLIEAEQCASLSPWGLSENQVDGITFDQAGNPILYEILKNHPGSGLPTALESEKYRADLVCHLFRSDRPGQRRGIPELTPALPLFAILRRWTLASLMSAEAAANFSMLLYTDNPPDGETYQTNPFDSVTVDRNMMMTLPAGWKPEQMEAKHPNATFAEVQKLIIAEIGRAMEVPYIIAAGNSSDSNYASGRLDWQLYRSKVRIDRSRIERLVLRSVFNAWKREAILTEGLLPQEMRRVDSNWSHQWMWDGWQHVDPQKEANAQATRLESNTTTLAEEYAQRGLDWEEQVEQRAREIAKLKELGITQPEAAPKTAPAQKDEEDTEEDEDEEDDGEEAMASRILRDSAGRVIGWGVSNG